MVPTPAVWEVGVIYPFSVGIHCGISESFPLLFDGSAWVPNSGVGPGGELPSPIPNNANSDSGTLELKSEDRAVYRSRLGPVIELRRLSAMPSLRPCV